MKIKEKIGNIIKWLFYKIAKWKLFAKKHGDLAIFEIMEVYITEAVLGGQEFRREELAKMQRRIEETKKFIKFLRQL